MLIETSDMRLVDRRLQPSTRAERIWTRFAVLSLFILIIILERSCFVNYDVKTILTWLHSMSIVEL